jgi:hypothetical protein
MDPELQSESLLILNPAGQVYIIKSAQMVHGQAIAIVFGDRSKCYDSVPM